MKGGVSDFEVYLQENKLIEPPFFGPRGILNSYFPYAPELSGIIDALVDYARKTGKSIISPGAGYGVFEEYFRQKLGDDKVLCIDFFEGYYYSRAAFGSHPAHYKGKRVVLSSAPDKGFPLLTSGDDEAVRRSYAQLYDTLQAELGLSSFEDFILFNAFTPLMGDAEEHTSFGYHIAALQQRGCKLYVNLGEGFNEVEGCTPVHPESVSEPLSRLAYDGYAVTVNCTVPSLHPEAVFMGFHEETLRKLLRRSSAIELEEPRALAENCEEAFARLNFPVTRFESLPVYEGKLIIESPVVEAAPTAVAGAGGHPPVRSSTQDQLAQITALLMALSSRESTADDRSFSP